MITMTLLYYCEDVHCYEYMDDWEKFNKTLLWNEDFDSHLNMKDVTHTDYGHAKKVCEDFEIKH